MGWTEWLQEIKKLDISALEELVMSNSIPTYDPPENDEDIDPLHFPYLVYSRVTAINIKTGHGDSIRGKLDTIFIQVQDKLRDVVLELDRPIPAYKIDNNFSCSCVYFTLYKISLEYGREAEVARVYSNLFRRHDISRRLTSLAMVNVISLPTLLLDPNI